MRAGQVPAVEGAHEHQAQSRVQRADDEASMTFGWEWNRFVAYFYFISWNHLALGVSLWLTAPRKMEKPPVGGWGNWSEVRG